MSTGIDVIACVTGASAVTVTVGGRVGNCTASDGMTGTPSVLHLALVDSTSVGVAFDYTQAFALWGAAFTSIVLLYFAGQGIGIVLNAIRGRF